MTKLPDTVIALNEANERIKNLLRATKTEDEIEKIMILLGLANVKHWEAGEITKTLGYFLREETMYIDETKNICINLHNENGYLLANTIYAHGDYKEMYLAWVSMFTVVQAIYFTKKPKGLLEEFRINVNEPTRNGFNAG
jgi:hypothetical protein